MPAPKRGFSKTRSALRTPNNASGDSRHKSNQPRRVHFDAQSQRGPSSNTNQQNGGAPSAPRGRGRDGRNPTGRTNPQQQPKSSWPPQLGGHEIVKAGKSSIPDAMTAQITNHITQQPQKPKRDWTGISDGSRFETLKRRRDHERTEGIKNGTVPDPNKQMKLSDAITLVGTCEDMCPEYERVKRIVEKDVWYEERDERFEDPGVRSHRKADENRMVKRFARSAAGQEEQLPSDLRPPPVLSTTLDYLLDFIAGRAGSLASVHHFVWDRTRAIRNDFSIQQVSRPNDVRIAIHCFEVIARFHIVSLHQLAQPERPYDEYDPQQEREQLDKTILSLIQLYEDHKDKYRSEDEAEFRAYQILFQIQKPSPNLEDKIQCWDDYIVQDPQVQHALKIYRVACNWFEPQGPMGPRRPHRIAQSDWMSFWSVMASPETSYLMGCVAEIYFPLMRRTALMSIWNAFKPKTNQESIDWTLQELQEVLGMEDLQHVAGYVTKFGFQLKQGDDGSQRVDLQSVSGIFPDPHIGQDCTPMVEEKRRGFKMPALAKNLERDEAVERNLIEDEEGGDDEDEEADEDASEDKEDGEGGEQSLFVPDTSKPSLPPGNPHMDANGLAWDPSMSNSLMHGFGQSQQPPSSSTHDMISSGHDWDSLGFSNDFHGGAASSVSDIQNRGNDPQRQKIPPFATAVNAQKSSQSPFSTAASGSISKSQTQTQGLFSSSPAFTSGASQTSTSMFAPQSSGGDNPFKSQFERQQSAAEKVGHNVPSPFGQPNAAAASDSATKDRAQQQRIAAERQAREQAARAQDEAKRAAEARTVEEQQKQRAAAMEAERAAKERAAKEMAERRRLTAQKAEEERRKADMERQRAAAAQEAERKAAESTKGQVFEEIARRLLLEPGGFLDQFVEYKAGPIIQRLQNQAEEARLRKQAYSFRFEKLQRRYGALWKEICRKRSLARAGRERRARRRQGQEEREKRAHEASVAEELAHFRRSQKELRTSRESAHTSSRRPSPPHVNSDRRSVRFSRPSLASSPTSSNPSMIRSSHPRHPNPHLRNKLNGIMISNTSPPQSSQSSSSPPPYDAYKVTNGILSRSQVSPPSTSASKSDHVPFDGLSYTEWMAQRRAAKGRASFRDSTNSTYFRMKAMGLDPNAGSLSPYASARSKSPPSLKRPRESDSLNSSFIEPHGAGSPNSDQDIAANRRIMPPPPPRKTVRLSPSSQDVKTTSLNSNGDSTKQPRASVEDDDDEFLQKVKEISDVFREGEEWYRGERQVEEKRRSVRSSRRASIASQSQSPPESEKQHWAGHPAEATGRRLSASHHGSRWEPYAPSTSKANAAQPREYDPTPPAMAPLKYRMRQSKFLPRDQYADARAERGESMYIGSARASQSAASPPSDHHDVLPPATGFGTELNGAAVDDSMAYGTNPFASMLPDSVPTQKPSSPTPPPPPPPEEATANNETVKAPSSQYTSVTSKLNNHSSSFLGLGKTGNANNIFGSSSTFSGFGAPATIAPEATIQPAFAASSFTPANATSKPSPSASKHTSRPSSPVKDTSSPQPSKTDTQYQPPPPTEKPQTNGDSSHPHPETLPGNGPFATESAHQNPFSQPSQYAQKNPFKMSLNNSLAPKSAKKNPFSTSTSSNGSEKNSKPNPFASSNGSGFSLPTQEPETQIRIKSTDTTNSKTANPKPDDKKSNKSNANPFQSTQKSSFGSQSGNPFAALADLSNDADDAFDGDREDELVHETEQFAQGEAFGDEEMSELADEGSEGFSDSLSGSGSGSGSTSGSDGSGGEGMEGGEGGGSDEMGEDEIVHDTLGQDDGNESEDKANGKGGTSVEDAIEL